MAPTRWGIASTGRISCDFVNALSLLPKEDHQVAAVGARSLERAKKFAKESNIPRSYGSYKELADDPDLDVVYVGTIHPTHFEVCKMLIEAGKNVLCEKPMTMNATQAKIILDMAKEKNVFFMEGFWSRFFPVYDKLREVLANGVIGDVKFVKAWLGMALLEEDGPIDMKAKGEGATLDIGGYPVQFAQLIFNEYPEKIVSSGTLSEDGIETGSFVTLHYSGNRVAQLSGHADVNLSNSAEIYGSKGMIQIKNFWSPDSITIAGETLEFPLPKASKPMTYINSEGFIYEAEAVRQSLLKGEKQNPKMTWQDSLWNMSILTEILTQNKVTYDELASLDK